MTIDTQKLRHFAQWIERRYPEGTAKGVVEAADHIDALEADNKRLREALDTIAAYPYARDQEMGVAAMRNIARAALSGEGK